MKVLKFRKIFILLPLYFAVISGAMAQSKTIKDAYHKPFYPTPHSTGEGVLCSLGKFSGCEPISSALLKDLDECSGSIRIVGGLIDSVGFLLRDEYAETFFFQELATRTVRSTDCQIKILEPSQRAPLNKSGWALFQEIQPLLQLLVKEHSRLQKEHDSLSLLAGQRTASRSGITSKRKKLKAKISSVNDSIDGLLSQLPFGSQKDTREALKPVIGISEITEEQFSSAFSSGLNSVRASLLESQDTYRKALDKNTGEYKLSTSQKIVLYGTPGAQKLLAQVDPKHRSLGCMFDACYKTGPKNAKIAALVGLTGATILSAGQASPLLAAATTLGAVSLSANQIQNSCFSKTIASTSDIYDSCSAYTVANTALSKVSGVQCAVDVALFSLDAVPGIAAVRKLAQARRLAGSKEVPKLIVSQSDKALTLFRKHQFDKNVDRYSKKYRLDNPKATKAEIHSSAHAQAAAKQERIIDLHKQCTTVKPNTANSEAAKIFTKYTLGTSAANTMLGYTIATWDQVKDFKWATKLGYEVTSAVTIGWLSSKIISGPKSFPKKVLANNLTSFVGNIADSLVYQGLFTSTEEARLEIEKMAKSPTFVSDVNNLLEYLNKRPKIQEYVDGIGDMSNNLFLAMTGKEEVRDMSAEELSRLSADSLKDPKVRERILDLIDDKLHAADKNYTTGNTSLDRLSFNTAFNLANIPVQTAVGMAAFYAVCMNIDSPMKALASFSAIQFVRGNVSNYIYYRTRENVISQ